MDDQDLLAKTRAVEAFFAGASTAGERDAAAAMVATCITHLAIAGTKREEVAAWGGCAVRQGRVVWRGQGAAVGMSAYRMELLGVVDGLRQVPSGRVRVHIANNNIIQTASTWLAQWRRRGWRKKKGQIEHLDLVRALATELDRLEVSWTHVGKDSERYIQAKVLARDAAERAAAIAPKPVPSPQIAQGGLAVPRSEAATGGGQQVAPAQTRVVAYTDGGCRGNPGVGGWGFLLIDVEGGSALERRGGVQHTTNNRMEMLAAIEALSSLRRDGERVEVRTDSSYLCNLAERWLDAWRRRGWRRADGEPIKNLDLVQRLDALLQLHRVCWRKVPGHAGEPGNEYVDDLANAAMDDVVASGDGAAERRHRVSPVAILAER